MKGEIMILKKVLLWILVIMCFALTFHVGRLYQIRQDEKSLLYMSWIVDRAQNQSNILLARLKKADTMKNSTELMP
jgi:hypothetical protein